MTTIIITVLTLSILGVVLATVLYIVAQKFKIDEDPRIDNVAELLPGANCGGCGFAGCRAFAEAMVNSDTMYNLYCPVGSTAVMEQIAIFLNKTVAVQEHKVATVRCAGEYNVRLRTSIYDGAKSCLMESMLYKGDTDCRFGCLGNGDCENACIFDAIHINIDTRLPEINEERCTACGACVKACPKYIIELRKKGSDNKRIFVSCVNKDRGIAARKTCSVACIGCAKCRKICSFGAIAVENSLAYIDFNKCSLCLKCIEECPTGAIKLNKIES